MPQPLLLRIAEALVQINTDHVKATEIPYHCFEKTCFGSKFMGSYKEVDKFFLKMGSIGPKNQPGRNSFLKIALFDIWLCNEDRHWENLNLLFDPKSQKFAPIDHVQCFNGANLGKEPTLISHNESLLTSPLLSHFFNRSLQRNANEIRLTILYEFRNHVQQCHEQIDNILANIPLDWKPDIQSLRSDLDIYFSPQWLKKCETHFTDLFHQNIKKPLT